MGSNDLSEFEPIAIEFVVGIDPSVTKTGMVIYDIREDQYYGYLVKAWKTDKDPGRMRSMTKGLEELFCKHALAKKVLVVIEQPTPRTAYAKDVINVGLFWSIRMLLGKMAQVYTLVVSPSAVAKFASGDGAKKDLGANIERRWGSLLERDPDPDVWDALAMEKMGECFLTPEGTNWTKFQVEAATVSKKTGRIIVVNDTASIDEARFIVS